MENQKLRVKIGEHEFEAEGSAESVTAQFEVWKSLISAIPQTNSGQKEALLKLSRSVEEVKTRDGYNTPTWDVFECDEKKKLIYLKVHPSGDSRDADALLLILWGYKTVFSMDEVPVTSIKLAMDRSGIPISRIDRSIEPLLSSGLVLKGGRGKGGKYRITTIGASRGEDMARLLFEKLI